MTKLKETNKKITEEVVKYYKKIETSVVNCSKNIKQKIKNHKKEEDICESIVEEDFVCLEEDALSLSGKKGFTRTTFDILCTSAKKHFEITKETYGLIKKDSNERIEYVKENNEYFQDFITAPNMKDKTKAVMTYAKDGGKTLVKRMKPKNKSQS